jgi:hypothetical protein
MINEDNQYIVEAELREGEALKMGLGEIPKAAQHALGEDEVVQWIGQPSRFPKPIIWFFRILYGFLLLFAIAAGFEYGIPLLQGKTPVMNGEPVTFKSALPPTLLFIICFGGFWFLYKWNFGKYRYIVTNKRAFHYRPIWGGSWRWKGTEGFKRNYDDPEYSPISGGYFTNETTVSIYGSDIYGTIEIGPLKSSMDDAQTIKAVKTVLPFLDNIIYDPSNLDFVEVKNPAMVEKEINSVLRKFKNEQAH